MGSVQCFHGIARFQLARFLERCGGRIFLLVAMQEQQHVGVLDVGDGRIGCELQRGLDMRLGFTRLGTVRQPADHGADLVDDLGVVQRQRRVRLGMLGLALQGGVERGPGVKGAISGIFGTKNVSREYATYYFALRVSIKAR